MIFDSRICELGEGVLWQADRQMLWWFDILNARLLGQGPDGAMSLDFPEMVSAMGLVTRDIAVVAGESGLWRVNLEDGGQRLFVRIAAGQPETRSNDGRADRQGGFWWGTMGKRGGADPGMGAIWRWYRGELRCLFPGLTIPNAICFAPDGRLAYFADTVTQKVMRVALDAEGWPQGAPSVFLDLRAEGLFPDGAVIDARGQMWLAQWGAGRVACYTAEGRFVTALPVEAPHASCPAFGGPDLTTLYVTTAQAEMMPEALAACPDAGKVFALEGAGKGLAEPLVRLD
jgi:sugar lactone lactonase YvrE